MKSLFFKTVPKNIPLLSFFFFFNDTATTEIYTLSLHDALPIFTENIINGVERPVNAAELFAFTLRVRAGNNDVLTDAEENVRQKLRADGVMYCLKVKHVLALALVVRSRCEVLKASVKALVFGM